MIECALLRRIHIERISGFICCDVQIKRAIAVNVGERHGRRHVTAGQPAGDGAIGEVPAAIIEIQFDGTTECADDEIEIAISVHIREHDTRGRKAGEIESTCFRDIGEVKATIVVIECGRFLFRRKHDIGLSITIDVAERNAGAIEQSAIGQSTLVVDVILMREPGRRCIQQLEAGVPFARHVERAPTIPCLLVPSLVD